jgi:hypothetical protein
MTAGARGSVAIYSAVIDSPLHLLLGQRDWLTAPGEFIHQTTNVFGKGTQIRDQVGAETCEGYLWRSNNEQRAEQDQIHEVNEDEREKCAVIAQVALIFGNHPGREGKMKCPGGADDGEEELTVRCNIGEQTRQAVNCDRDHAVKGKEIRSKRDPEVGAIGDDVAAGATNTEFAHASAHEQNPKGVGEFVSEDINDDGPRQAEEGDKPEHGTEGEEPELGPGPESLGKRCASERSKKCLGENGAPGEEEHRDDIFNPSRRNGERYGMVGRSSCGGDDVRYDLDPGRLFVPATSRDGFAAW